MMEEQSKDLREYIGAFKRRKKQIYTAIGLLALASVLVAFLLPPVYRSSATILIEEQEIPPELVRSTITSYADQRLQVISQQVMTRANMMQIVEKYNLYATKRKHETSEEILDRMRKDVKFNIVSADVIDRRSGMKTVATIAFTLAFDSDTPQAAQNVANELTTLYLNENLKTRKQKSAETSSFLTEEVSKLSDHISQTEAKLAAFKAKNGSSLPELTQLNMQLRDRTDAELMETDRQLSVLAERKFYLEGQLAQMKPNTPMMSASGDRILDSDERLRVLQSQYASLSGVYSPKHPDVIKMKREIDALKKEIGGSSDYDEEAKQLGKMRTDLAAMREKYSDDYPDVVKLKKSIASLEAATKKAAANSAAEAPKPKKPENPAYITLQSQLDATEAELKTTRAKRAELQGKMGSYESSIEKTPQVEREYLDLSRDHENSLKRYQELKEKQMEAQVGQEMEKDSKGERFSLIDPAQLPEKPNSPNRPAILLLGAILSLGGGVAYAGVLESMDGSVRNPKGLTGLVKAPLLSVIPYIENSADKRQQNKLKISVLAGAAVLTAVTLITIHFLWMPLDVLWYSLLRKMNM